MKLTRLVWTDSSNLCGWHDADEVMDHRPSKITTVGFLVNEGKDFVTITAHDGGHEFNSAMCIPKCAILERKDYK